MSEKVILSVVLAVHNEAENIERCLAAVKDLADEIIVVDGESTDKTAVLAKKFGAEIIKTTNKSNFHINKQMAMDAAQGLLVLQLDADEVVDEELRKYVENLQLQAARETLPDQPKAWNLSRKNYFLGRFLSKGGQYPDKVIRLYQRGFAQLPQKNVHEQMVVDGQVTTAEGHLLHYANPSFSVYMRKFNTYTSFEAERLVKERVGSGFWLTAKYWIVKPAQTFFSLYLRHRGYVDGMAGFIFALMSSLHHPVVHLKLYEKAMEEDL